jgi:hypothetical protein
MRVRPQSSQYSIWPPGAAERRAAIAPIARHSDAPEMSGVRSFVTLAVTAEDIGQFEGRRPSGHS